MNVRTLLLSVATATAILGTPAIASAATASTKLSDSTTAPTAKPFKVATSVTKTTVIPAACRHMTGKQLQTCEAKNGVATVTKTTTSRS